MRACREYAATHGLSVVDSLVRRINAVFSEILPSVEADDPPATTPSRLEALRSEAATELHPEIKKTAQNDFDREREEALRIIQA